MLGNRIKLSIKKSQKLTILVLASLIMGCQANFDKTENIQNEEITTSQFINDSKNYFELIDGNKTISNFARISSDELLEPYLQYPWFDDLYFTPKILSDNGILYGQADAGWNITQPMSDDVQREIYLAYYDMNQGEFKIIKSMQNESMLAMIKVILVTDDLLIFEEYEQDKDAKYFIYDFKNETIEELYHTTNTPPHYTMSSASDEGIMLGWYDDKIKGYSISFYSYDTKKLETIEESNSGYPVYFKGNWYYLLVDNDQLVTQLIQYDRNSKTKTVLYETVGLEDHMFGLYGDENNLLLVIENDPIEKIFKVDVEKKQLIYYFEDEWIETINIKNGKMTWLGSKTIESRSRPQYYLFDLNKEINYESNDGSLFLSNNGIVWVDLKKPDQEIEKGRVFYNDNSQLSYHVWK